jgi:hypothetical protein
MTKQEIITEIEKGIEDAAKMGLFEINDGFTQSQARAILNPYLKDKVEKGEVKEFLVVCDESNNIDEVVKRNEFVVDTYIRFTDDTEFMVINAIASPTGVEIETIVGTFP